MTARRTHTYPAPVYAVLEDLRTEALHSAAHGGWHTAEVDGFRVLVPEAVEDQYRDGSLRPTADLRVLGTGRPARAFGIGYTPEGREVQYGPMVADLAYAYGLPVVIADTPLQGRPCGLAEAGDHVSIGGRFYRVRIERNEYVVLDLIVSDAG